jgi:hypothetical protein
VDPQYSNSEAFISQRVQLMQKADIFSFGVVVYWVSLYPFHYLSLFD